MGGRLNANGENEAAVTARTKIGKMKLRECEELLYGRNFFVKDQRKNLSELYKIGNAAKQRDVVSEKYDGTFENYISNDESNLWS